MMATSVLDGAVDSTMVSADMRQRCEQLGIAASALSDDFLRQCLCVMRVGRLDKHCTEMMDRTRQLTADDQVVNSGDDLSAALARNATEPEPDEQPDDESDPDNLINSDVFIYVIVFIVIVYFLTFLYLCMKKRQREAEDAEAGTGGAGAARRNNRNATEDQPPSYDEVMGSGAVGGKNAEPPTYAEVLARSQQLDKVEQGSGS